MSKELTSFSEQNINDFAERITSLALGLSLLDTPSYHDAVLVHLAITSLQASYMHLTRLLHDIQFPSHNG